MTAVVIQYNRITTRDILKRICDELHLTKSDYRPSTFGEVYDQFQEVTGFGQRTGELFTWGSSTMVHDTQGFIYGGFRKTLEDILHKKENGHRVYIHSVEPSGEEDDEDNPRWRQRLWFHHSIATRAQKHAFGRYLVEKGRKTEREGRYWLNQ